MNRLEKLLNDLDKKNLIMLYASIFIAFFVIYYNYNYEILYNEINQNENQIVKLKRELVNINSYSRKISKYKKELEILKKNNISLQEDLKYLRILIKTSPILLINEIKFLDIIKNILQSATDNDIKATYEINRNFDKYKIYTINVTGEFSNKNFFSFHNFIKDIEKMNIISKVENLEFLYNGSENNVKFKFIYNIWGL